MNNLTPKQLHILKHSYGYDSRNPGFRGHYCTEVDDADLLKLKELDLMVGPTAIGMVGEGCGIFHLTDKVKELLKDMKLVKS